jgi:hypothetical protein
MAGVPLKGATPAWLRSSPPKRLFGLVNDVTPGKADIVQVAIGPLRQFAPLTPTISPDMQLLVELRQKPGTMMIYHRFM